MQDDPKPQGAFLNDLQLLFCTMVLNVIEPAQTRYILAAEDLENFLKEKFGDENPDYDFKVEVCDTIKNTTQIHSLLSRSMYVTGGPSKRLRK
jgi:hypothetical protein